MPGKRVSVFLDSNVIISGLFSARGASRLILDIMGPGLPAVKALTGRYNIIEIERNLKDKLPGAGPLFRAALRSMDIGIVPLPAKRDVDRLAGLTADKDLPVLASAVLGSAEILVTGNLKHLLRLEKCRLPFLIVPPAEFLDKLLPGILRRWGGSGG